MIKDIIAQNENATPNSKEIEILKTHFPSCFNSEGEFDIERFKGLIGDEVSVTHEGYELKFLGKNYARLLASTDTETVITPDEEHNSLPENKNSGNIYISADNLDALKHLKKSYEGAIKCIYIDPPYNTGTDGFVYKDNFGFTAEELSEKLSIDEEQAQRILNFTKKGSASHSAWLMFMYPRLALARDLLTKDGVIFISIDDNEQANLKLVCDEIFGEQNFISTLVWEKKKKGSYLTDSSTNIKEYILVYAANKNGFSGLIGQINNEVETYPCINAVNARDVRVIPAGIVSKYKEKNYSIKKGKVISDTTMSLLLKTDLVIKDGKLAQDLIIEGNWRYGQEAMSEYAKNGKLYITRDLYLRRIVSESRKKGLKDLLLRIADEKDNDNPQKYSYSIDVNNLQKSGWGSNEDADDEQRILLGEQSLMSYPKPVLLIMKLIASIQSDNFIVCDFFSGSATTSEAVMRLNVMNNKHIQYIAVQLPENILEKHKIVKGDEKERLGKLLEFLKESHRPQTLNYLGIERIRRAAEKLREEYPDTAADLGFKHYTLKEVSIDTLDKLDDFNGGSFLENNLLDEFGIPTVLTTWLVRDGYGFSAPVQAVDFEGYTAYYCKDHLYLLNEGISDKAVAAAAEKLGMDKSFTPKNIVLFGYSFNYTQTESLKTNLKLVNDKLKFDVRY